MRIALNLLAAIASIAVMILCIQADKTELAAVWGMTSGMWIGNVILAMVGD